MVPLNKPRLVGVEFLTIDVLHPPKHGHGWVNWPIQEVVLFYFYWSTPPLKNQWLHHKKNTSPLQVEGNTSNNSTSSNFMKICIRSSFIFSRSFPSSYGFCWRFAACPTAEAPVTRSSSPRRRCPRRSRAPLRSRSVLGAHVDRRPANVDLGVS